MSPAKRLLIFDLDGTLVDSAPDIIATVNALMRSRGRNPLPDSRIIEAIGYGLKRTVFELFSETHHDPESLKQLEAEFFRFYEANLLNQTQPYPGCIEFLESLSARKEVETQIAIVTNKYVRLAEKLIAHLPLAKFEWVAILGADSMPKAKPDPMPLREVMRRADIGPEDTVMIGDGIPDMEAARAAGVTAIACSFGYTPLDRLQAAGAHLTMHRYSELPELIASVGAR